MEFTIAKDGTPEALVLAALEGTLTEEQAEQLAALDANLSKLAWLAASQRIAEQNSTIADLREKLTGPRPIDPATPSGQRPVYAKPTAPRRKGKPGAKVGHKPARRPEPKRVAKWG